MEENFSPEKYLTQTGLLKKTLDQIEKDFSASGIDFTFEKMAAPVFEDICNAIQKRIGLLMSGDSGALNNLLYRIDLSEKKVKQLLHDEGELKFQGKLAEMIVKRELQKVVIREYYKQNKNEDHDTEG